MPAPIPECEPARVLALRLLDILDTAPEPAYNDVVALASQCCDAPTALVSLVDSHRQWFKAQQDFDVAETPRDLAFCAYAILQKDILVVSDTRKDARFAEHPLVIGPPYIRFYAGAPLIMEEGLALGTLCVIDYVPRVLMAEQMEALQLLAKHVMSLLALRRQPSGADGSAEPCVAVQRALQVSYKEVEALWRQEAVREPQGGKSEQR